MDILSESLKQGIAPAIVVAIYLIITKIIDSRKESKQIKLNTELVESITNINNFIISITKDIIDKEKIKCQRAVEDSMYAAGMRLINFVSTTIINNHVETNKENILSNIHNIVTTEYYSVYSTLSMYVVNNKKISKSLKPSWIEDVKKDMIDIVYNTNLAKEDKIMAFTNKINIRFQSYSTYINNNAIKI